MFCAVLCCAVVRLPVLLCSVLFCSVLFCALPHCLCECFCMSKQRPPLPTRPPAWPACPLRSLLLSSPTYPLHHPPQPSPTNTPTPPRLHFYPDSTERVSALSQACVWVWVFVCVCTTLELPNAAALSRVCVFRGGCIYYYLFYIVV